MDATVLQQRAVVLYTRLSKAAAARAPAARRGGADRGSLEPNPNIAETIPC